MTGTCVRQSSKELVWEYWRQIDAADQRQLPSVASRCLDEGVVWTGFHPFNELRGRDGILNGWWLPLRTAFPDVRRDIYILLSGSYAGKDWVSATGYFSGTFAADWAGIPATGRWAWTCSSGCATSGSNAQSSSTLQVSVSIATDVSQPGKNRHNLPAVRLS